MTNFIVALPEFILLLMACAVLMAEVFRAAERPGITYRLSQYTLMGVLLLTWMVAPDQRTVAFNDSFVADPMATMLKCAILLVTLGVFVYSREYLAAREILKGEYFVLGLFAVLGMMVMVSANSLLTVYLGLELLSLSLYAMVAMHRDSSEASEAAMKYFVLGALASGMMLYGISILYGVTGSLELSVVSSALAQQTENASLLAFGLVFVVAGIAFKFGVAPFHMWIPDVYQGAPTSVTLFIGTAPKLSAFAMTMRLLVDGMGSLLHDWQQMMMILAVLSMAIGNIVAISQTNIKRMLAYSTIAHMGFLFLGMLSGTQSGYAGSMFYVIVYALMSMGSFGMIILLGRSGFESDKLDDFKGLSDRSPWFAFLLMMIMFSLAGVPPFVGFWAKWFVIKEVLDVGFVWLAGIAVVFSIVGAFYYLRIVKLLYFDRAEEGQQQAITSSRDMQVVMSINGVAVLLLGLVPGLLMALCLSVMKAAG